MATVVYLYDELLQAGKLQLASMQLKSFGYDELRHCKTKQKVSGCFRSWQGVLDYCNLQSLLSASKKRDKNLFDVLHSLCSY